MKQVALSLLLLLSLLAHPLVAQNNTPITYTVQAGETLYSISRAHDVTVQQLIDANPSSLDGLSIGEVLVIPAQIMVEKEKVTYLNHTVKRWQTLYGIAKQYGVTIEQILQSNPGLTTLSYKSVIKIPRYETIVVEQEIEAEEDSLASINPHYNTIALPDSPTGIKVALLLPFMLNDTLPNAKASLYVEFYEGFLLSVEAYKKAGCNIEIYAYDTEYSNIKVSEILRKEELQYVDLIIAPDNEAHIGMVSRFAARYGIKVVNAFSLNSNEVQQNPYLFQVNTTQDDLFDGVIAEFITRFSQQHIVFTYKEGTTPDKREFIAQFKQELTRQAVPYIEYNYSDDNTLQKLDSLVLVSGDIVIVPETSNKVVLANMMTSLTKLIEDRRSAVSLTLFGYPEWQMYTPDFLNRFYTLNTYIYSRFYVNPLEDATQIFYDSYNHWYSKEPSAAYPRYAMLGYDIGAYFLQALCSYGRGFDDALTELTSESLQTDFSFKRVNDRAGYVNKSLYFVHFTPSRTIHKYKID